MGFPTGGTGTSAPLPTGAATAARQDTGNASLALIDSKLTPPVAVEIEGHLGNGVVNELIRATPFGALHTSIVEPLSCSGQLHVAEPNPRVQIESAYGILTTDVQTLVDSGSSGSVTKSNGLFLCQSGTAVGGYGVLRSNRIIRNRPGQPGFVIFNVIFGTPVANCFLAAGAFNSFEALYIGYRGTSFGYIPRIPGAVAIHRLMVTTGTTGAETVTVKLNGVAFNIAVTAGSSTASVAQQISAYGSGFTGWSSTVSPTSNGSTVTFLQSNPAATAGAFTMTTSVGGTAAGSFTTLQAGAANDDATGFVAQSNFNVDVLDGSNSAQNPSGMLLNPQQKNRWQIEWNSDTTFVRIRTADGKWSTVHVDASTPAKNQSYRVGWVAASLGSSTNVTTSGSSASGFVSGKVVSFRDPYSISQVFTGVSVTEYAYLLIRNRAEFASVVNQRQLQPILTNLACETNARIVRARIVINPSLSSTVDWAYVDQNNSSTEYSTPSSVTMSGGRTVAAFPVSQQSSDPLYLKNIRLEPGDVLAVGLRTASSTATAELGIDWDED